MSSATASNWIAMITYWSLGISCVRRVQSFGFARLNGTKYSTVLIRICTNRKHHFGVSKSRAFARHPKRENFNLSILKISFVSTCVATSLGYYPSLANTAGLAIAFRCSIKARMCSLFSWNCRFSSLSLTVFYILVTLIFIVAILIIYENHSHKLPFPFCLEVPN